MRKLFGFLILNIVFIGTLSGQKYAFEIQEINVKDGLPHRSIYDIGKDRQGYLWLSYQGGICRYDGYDFKTFPPSFLNIGKNPVHFSIDKHNRIWYSENSRYENSCGIILPETDSILTIDEFSNGLINSSEIFSINNSRANPDLILIVTNQGTVFKYDSNADQFAKIFETGKEGIYMHCESFKEGVYWIAAHNCIYMKDENTGETKVYKSSFEGMQVIKLTPYYSNFIIEAKERGTLDEKYFTVEDLSLIHI